MYAQRPFLFLLLTPKPPYSAGHGLRKGGRIAVSPGGFMAGHSWHPDAGTVERVHSMALSIKPIAMYLKRFAFVREFFPDNPTPDLDAFFLRFKARLYTFTPTAVDYIDNRLGFGTRHRIDW
jgi:hypothetical protein